MTASVHNCTGGARAFLQADVQNPTCNYLLMPSDSLAATRAALRQMMEAAGVSDLTQLARKAGIAHTTLTRIMSDEGADVTWSLSAKTWMKLSAVSGVPITLLGDRIVVPDTQPRLGETAAERRRARLLEWWDNLPPGEQEHFFRLMTSWAQRTTGMAEAV